MVPPLCALEFFFMRGMLVCFAGVLHCLEDILQLVLRFPTTERSVMLCCDNSLTIGKVPCEQIFLSYMAFSVYEVACVACQPSQFKTDKRRERLCKR